jgi:glycosyltransferase involved in cell wall biosynthesis
MKIGIVCQYFPPESNAPAIRTYEHAVAWARRGHDVTVLTGFPSHPTGIVPEEYRGEWLRTEFVSGVEVVRSWTYAAANRGRFKRVASFLTFCLSSTVAGRLHVRPDVILATSPQFFSAVSGYFLSRLHGVPFVLELRDLWPQVAVDMGVVSGASVRPLIRLQRTMYAHADRIVIVSEGFRQHLHDAGVPDSRISYVPNGISEDVLAGQYETSGRLRARLGLAGRFIVSYIGTHGLSQGLEVVLDAAELLRDQPDVHFLLVGDGAERAALEQQAAARGLRNVTFLGQQPRDTAVACYRASDVSLVPLRDIAAFRQVLPSKLFEIMGAGVPIICGVAGEAARLVERSGGGLVVPPESAQAVADAVLRLRQNPAERKRLAEAGREFVLREHLRERLAERMALLLEELAPGEKEPPVTSMPRLVTEKRAGQAWSG